MQDETEAMEEGMEEEGAVDISALARRHAPAVFASLLQVALQGQSEASRISASKEILDRAFKKSTAGSDNVQPGLSGVLVVPEGMLPDEWEEQGNGDGIC
jgi:hypothetical protein